MCENDQIPWPQKGDELFKPGEDWWHNACLNYYPSEDWNFYAIGYKKAADSLVEQIKETRSDQDILVFPIVFLYRHYLELRMKELIKDGKEYLDEVPEFPQHHKLDSLWSDCKSVLMKIEKISKSDCEAVNEAINQFYEIDPSSEVFRYPVNKKGKKSIPITVKYINLRNLSEVMDRIAGFFEAACMMISVYLDYKREMEADLRDAFGLQLIDE